MLEPNFRQPSPSQLQHPPPEHEHPESGRRDREGERKRGIRRIPRRGAGSPGAPARPVLKDLTRADLPRLVVLSQREIPRDTPIEIMGSVIEEEPEAVTTFTTEAIA